MKPATVGPSRALIAIGEVVMKTKLFAILFLAGSSLFARSHFSIAVGVGPGYGYGYSPGYYQPAPVVVYSPPPFSCANRFAPPFTTVDSDVPRTTTSFPLRAAISIF